MIYLGYLDDNEVDDDAQGPWAALVELRPGLVLVDSEQSRSVVYHALKDQLPGGTPLLVAELHEVPKFKGMRSGALRWARQRLPSRRRDG